MFILNSIAVDCYFVDSDIRTSMSLLMFCLFVPYNHRSSMEFYFQTQRNGGEI